MPFVLFTFHAWAILIAYSYSASRACLMFKLSALSVCMCLLHLHSGVIIELNTFDFHRFTYTHTSTDNFFLPAIDRLFCISRDLFTDVFDYIGEFFTSLSRTKKKCYTQTQLHKGLPNSQLKQRQKYSTEFFHTHRQQIQYLSFIEQDSEIQFENRSISIQ